MKRRRKTAAAVGGAAVVAAIAALVTVGGPANATPTTQPAPQPPDVLQQHAVQHQISDKLPASPSQAGRWIDATGKLVVAVVNEQEAAKVRQAGATPKLVTRSQAQLDDLLAKVDKITRADRGKGLQSWGIDPVSNKIVVKARGAYGALSGLGDGVQVVRVKTNFRQQAGEVNPGDPWWPGSESNCSVGFPATDAQGNKHFLTAGHCTNDANQAAYGVSGQSNKLGTSNVGGSRSVNAREGDMGVVAVTEAGWTISAAVNTWGQPALTVSGSGEAIVGDTVCHSGNTAPNFECGKVRSVNQSIDYGNVVIDGLTTTDACSQGGDSGGAWLRGDKAVGLHSGGNSSCVANDGNSIFQPVDEALTKWGLTLLTGTPDPGGVRTFSNGTDYPIRDFQTAVSPVRSTASGRVASPIKVTVEGSHTCLEDLNISLVSPSGRWYYLQRYGGYTCHPLPASKTYNVTPTGTENAIGNWTLRIGDNGPGDTGTLTNWSITL